MSDSKSLIERLEARIAPALTVYHPLPDLFVGPNMPTVEVDLTRFLDPFVTGNENTIVTLTTNLDADLTTPGLQASAPIVIELFDREAPLSVQNFLSYLTNDFPKPEYYGTFFHRAIPGFVLQGGGFNANSQETHIDTPFMVHNEFSPTRSNVLGTVAMAKTGLGPNTATTEWFFNLGNNSSNLDAQNGGFTVFGRVVSGLEVAQAAVNLPTIDRGGALTNLPVQNYVADPDTNPDTPPPAPTADQLVVITGASIQRPPSGDASGLRFSFNPAVDVHDAVTGARSDLVTGRIIDSPTGPKLSLYFKTHAAGVVNVSVHAADGSTATTDVFQINLQPNLVAQFAGDPFEQIIVGGDKLQAPIVIGNNGGGWAVGQVDVKVYLSEINNADPTGALVQPASDLLIGEYLHESIDIAPGGKQTLLRDLQIPEQLVTRSGGTYRILVQVTPVERSLVERFADDNVSLDSRVHTWENGFGNFEVTGFGERKGAVLKYREADGDLVSFSIDRGGRGSISFDGTFTDVAVQESRPYANLRFEVLSADGDGAIDLHNIELFKFIDRADFQNVTLTGSLSASGGVRELQLGDVTGEGRLTIGLFDTARFGRPQLTFGRVSDFSVESLVAVRSIRAVEWLETGGDASVISAPRLGKLVITGRAGSSADAVQGDFEADVALRGNNSLRLLSVAGFVRDADIVTTGNVGKVTVGGLERSSLFIGVTSLPNSIDDFATVRSLGSLIVRGVAGETEAFIDSHVAAAEMDSVFVTKIARDSEGGSFGLIADKIASYQRGNGRLTASDLSEPQRFDRQGDYRVRIV